MRQIINRTKEQQDYVDSIVKKKYRVKKAKKIRRWDDELNAMTPLEKCDYFIGNCEFWITEYKEGRYVNEEKLRSALNSLFTLHIERRKIIDNNILPH